MMDEEVSGIERKKWKAGRLCCWLLSQKNTLESALLSE